MHSALDQQSQQILTLVKQKPNLASSEIHTLLGITVELVTIKRNLAKLVSNQLLSTVGIGRGTKYIISPSYQLFSPVDLEGYFNIEVDQRQINPRYNFDLLRKTLPKLQLFSSNETKHLDTLQKQYKSNITQLSPNIYKKELERLAIDLSWKSSQIEGNTYSLLETEQLLKEHKEAKGKKKEDAIMLLNHKYALDYVLSAPKQLNPLTISKIEEIHRLLTIDLGIDQNTRKRIVGITGTNYKPLDNEFQIKEELSELCKLHNNTKGVFDRALLLLLFISYIQPFSDGNKRTARILSNASLISNAHCPLSFRTVDSIDYKKAMLLFYEQNNLTAFKQIFIDQYEFAVNTYF